jgi:ankyrin repeat protein
MQLILQHSASLRDSLRSFSPEGLLGRAITNQHLAAVSTLLQTGAQAGVEALLHAILSPNHAEACKLLLQHGAQDVSDYALKLAAYLGQQEVVDMLMSAGGAFSISEPAVTQMQAAIIAGASNGQLQVVQSLICTLDAKSKQRLISLQTHNLTLNLALEAACFGYHSHRSTTFALPPGFQGNTLPVQLQQRVGRSAPLFPRQYYKILLLLLLPKGASPDYEGGKLVLWAVQQKEHGILQALLDAGATHLQLALQEAAWSGNVRMVTQLLRSMRRPVDRKGVALGFAARHGHSDVLRLLLEKGANAGAALAAAVEQQDLQAAVALLQQPGVKVGDGVLRQQLLELADRLASHALMWELSKHGIRRK